MAKRTYKVEAREIDGQKLRGVKLPEIDMEYLPWGAPVPAAAYGAVSVHDDDGNVVSTEIPQDRFVPFAKPGLRVEADQLYVVKAMGPSGNLTQIPMEDQINNHVASPENHVGLGLYVKKGFIVFYDTEKSKGVFCPTKNCWAEWNDKNGGFCSEVHRNITKPDNKLSGFSLGATTSGSVRG